MSHGLNPAHRALGSACGAGALAAGAFLALRCTMTPLGHGELSHVQPGLGWDGEKQQWQPDHSTRAPFWPPLVKVAACYSRTVVLTLF